MKTPPKQRRQPTTVDELLDLEEALALEDIGGSLQGLGEGLIEAVGVRRGIRARPILAVGIAALAGLFAGPRVLKLIRQVPIAPLAAAGLASLRPASLQRLVQASQRIARARR